MRRLANHAAVLFLAVVCLAGTLDLVHAAQCEAEDCAAAPAYSIRIYTESETTASPDGPTVMSSEKGRTDAKPVTVEGLRQQATNQSRVNQQGSGTVWLSEDPSSMQRNLKAETGNTATLHSDTAGRSGVQVFEKPAVFKLMTNYPAFIERWEIRLWTVDTDPIADPVLILPAREVRAEYSLEWNGSGIDTPLNAGDSLYYTVRAYDKHGNFDQGTMQPLRLIDAEDKSKSDAVPELSVAQASATGIHTTSKLAFEGIALTGSKVRILAQDVSEGHILRINQDEFKVGEDGRLGVEYIVPLGQQDFIVSIVDGDEILMQDVLSVDPDPGYFFMVGLADITVGENRVTGSVEPLAVDQHHYGGDIFVDGRLAFYLKGKIQGKYLVTAQMDTGSEDIAHLFDDFHRRDSRSIFRRLDPDQYYPVYGDDSTAYSDTDTQGKFYVRVDWDRSRALWGNFNTNFTGTEFAPFNRSLYGGMFNYRSVENTQLGDTRASISSFVSQAQSLFRHNEFVGTGGSLYYLRDNDIVAGSEKVWVEVRQTDTQRVVSKVVLEPGRDYDMDAFQGRLILNRPLLSVAAQSGPSIIRDEPLAGNSTYLLVDYEYTPQNLDLDDISVGARGKHWLSENFAVGATWVHERRVVQDYDIKGVDVTLKRSDDSYIRGEIAQSSAVQTAGSFVSDDGGLHFESDQSDGSKNSGQAMGIEARMTLQEFNPDSIDIDAGAWIKRKAAGYSVAGSDTDTTTTDAGIEAVGKLTDRTTLSARATRIEKRKLSVDSVLAGQIDHEPTDRLVVSGELRQTDSRNLEAGSKAGSLLAAGKLSFDLNERLNTYASHQATLRRTGSASKNNATAVGANYKATDSFSVKSEASTGDKGDSALLGVDWQITDSYGVYSNYTYALKTDSVAKNTLVLGQRKTVSSRLKVYSEHQFTDEDTRQGYAHTVGLDQKFGQYTSLNLSYQKASVDNETDEPTKRDTASAGVKYQKDKVLMNSKLEYRIDRGPETRLRQWVTSNRFEYRKTPSFRWQGKANASISNDALSDEDARFVEVGIGFAFRPVSHDRLNMLGRITYLYDLPPLSQAEQSDQRSWVGSVEGLYDLDRRWSVGGKIAVRGGETRIERNTGEWIGNDASLLAVRTRYKVPFGVDATFAYHWLASEHSDNTRHGALFSVGTAVGDHLRLSVGYNFTAFDDDLARDDYDVQGWFVNLVGTY